MDRRGIYKLVAEFAGLAETPDAMLHAAIGAMRMLRGLSVESSDLAERLLTSALAPILKRDDALGEIHQALNAPALERAYRATTRERRKFSDSEIPSVTQLFTPRFVVEFLLHNSLGRLWMTMHPNSALRFRYQLPSREGHFSDPAPRRLLKDLRILDPACGTMNFGLVAIEMLDAMYREELATLGPSCASVASEDQIPSAIVAHNLFGIDIDPAALELAAQTLSMKLRLPVDQCRGNLWQGDALLDDDSKSRATCHPERTREGSGLDMRSQILREYAQDDKRTGLRSCSDEQIGAQCMGAFDVVATNPPYLSARNLDPARVAKIKRRYPASWRDAYACFIERSMEFARPGGYVGVLAMQSFMFTGAFQKLRENLSSISAIEAIAHFGPGLFEVGNPGTLQTAAIVLRREPDATRRQQNEVIALRLVDAEDKEREMGRVIDAGCAALPRRGGEARIFRVKQADLLATSRGAWVYWLTPQLRRVFHLFPRLGEIAEPRQGLATTDNARFVRYWWEVEPTRADAPCRASPGRWFPYVKSGRFRRWFESPRHRVNWADDGREIKQSIVERYPYLKGRWEWVAKNSQYYGRSGVTYSYLTAGAFSARLMPAGAIFDVAGSALFPDDPLTVLAILNSSVARELLHAVNPTVNFQVGDLAQLPMPCESDATLRNLAQRAVASQQSLDACDETSPEFISPRVWGDDATNLRAIEDEIDAVVAALYGLTAPASAAMAQASAMQAVVGDPLDLARRWVSYVVGRLLGRWGCQRVLTMLPLRPADVNAIDRIREELCRLAGERAARQIEEILGGIGSFLAGTFYSWHVKLYRYRPVYWALGDRASASLVLHDFATPELLSSIMKLPSGWQRCVDDGVAVNLAPMAEYVDDAALGKKLHEMKRDLESGRLLWAVKRKTSEEQGQTLV